jgi:hypothetical protein
VGNQQDVTVMLVLEVAQRIDEVLLTCVVFFVSTFSQVIYDEQLNAIATPGIGKNLKAGLLWPFR